MYQYPSIGTYKEMMLLEGVQINGSPRAKLIIGTSHGSEVPVCVIAYGYDECKDKKSSQLDQSIFTHCPLG